MLEKIRHLSSEKLLHGFKLLKVPELRLHVFNFEHQRALSKHLHLYRDDPNKTFRQEGWRIEPTSISDPSSKLAIKGIVFNEMKGVFSNSLYRFVQAVHNNLLPNSYPYVSGGLPEHIPSLTWSDLKEFHQKYYHPSNARFYTYGDLDLESCLEYLNKEYLSLYNPLEINYSVSVEPSWNAPRELQLTCEPDPMSPDGDRNCFVSLSYRLDDIQNIYDNFVLRFISMLLTDGDNAPLYQSLIDSGYGHEWISGCVGMSDEARTSSFHVGVQGVRREDLSKFHQIVKDTLIQVTKVGFPASRIEAVLHRYELGLRHDSSRFGLNLILALSNAVNHDADIEESLQIGSMLKRFRTQLESDPTMLLGYIEKYFLNNPHQLTTTMVPEKNWSVQQRTKDNEFVNTLTNCIGDSERAILVQKANELSEEQQMDEDVSCLPCLDLFDIPLESRAEPHTMVETADNCPVQINEAPANNLVYFHCLINLNELPSELLPYVPLFSELFTKLGASGLSYFKMDELIELNTGGLNAWALVTPILSSPNAELLAATNIHLSGYCLESKLTNFFDLWLKLFQQPNWLDRDRLTTLIMMFARSEWSMNAISSSAHRFAMRRAASNLTQTCRINELWFGLEQMKLINKIANKVVNLEANEDWWVALTEKMIKIWQFISSKQRMRFSLHGEQSGLTESMTKLETFLSNLNDSPQPDPILSTATSPNSPSVGLPTHQYFVTPYDVHYVAQAVKASSYDSESYASYRVLAELITSKFLHREIREKGGAYGGGAAVKPEAFYFYSYRDPHALTTFNHFHQAIHWASNTEFKEQDIMEAKLAVFQELDHPISAGSRGLTNFINGISDEIRQTHRNQVFSVNNDTLHEAVSQIERQQQDVAPPGRFGAVGNVVLGPEQSKDWPVSDSDQQWKTSVLSD